MITDTFDRGGEEILTPEGVYGKREKVCDTCIITFSKMVVESIEEHFPCTRIAEIETVTGNIPIYKLSYQGREYGFYLTMISSAAAGTCLEEAQCLTGATKFVMFGSCGSLDKNITAGKLIVPTYAYRDEGFSYHYAEPQDYIRIKNAEKVAGIFDELHLPYVMGKTWTTDAVYRETKENMAKRKAEGCVAVEMECAGVQAVCDFRGLEYYDFLISGDLLDAPEWDKRILGSDEELDHQLRNFYIALEVAARL